MILVCLRYVERVELENTKAQDTQKDLEGLRKHGGIYLAGSCEGGLGVHPSLLRAFSGGGVVLELR